MRFAKPAILAATAALASAAALLPASAAAEVVESGTDTFVTRDTAQIAATPLQVWLALTKPADWWVDEHTWSGDAENLVLTPQAGACFCERIPGDDADTANGGSAMDDSAMHAVIVQAYPLQTLRMRGGLGPLQGEVATGVLTITLKEVPGGTRVLWEYNVGGPMRYEVPTISKTVDAVMSQQLAALRDHLGPLAGGGAATRAPATAKAASKPASTRPSPTSVEDGIDAMASERAGDGAGNGAGGPPGDDD